MLSPEAQPNWVAEPVSRAARILNLAREVNNGIN